MRKYAPFVFGLTLAAWTGLTPVAAAGQDAPAAAAAPAADEQTLAVVTALRTALGGDAKLAALKGLTLEGSQRRVFGEQERLSDIELIAQFPNHIQRIEQFATPTGMPGPRMAQTLNGEDFWMGPLDAMPGGMVFRMGGEGPGGPGGGGRQGGPGGPGSSGNRQSQARGELVRTLLGILPISSALPGVTFTYAGEAKSNDGAADVLDVKSADFQAKLFVDKATHLPLMLTFQGPDPAAMASRMRTFQRRDGETPEANRARVEEERKAREAAGPPPPMPMVEHQLYFAEHKKVDGVMLPTRISRAVKGNTIEEIEIKKYKLNPKIDPAQFEKKKGS